LKVLARGTLWWRTRTLKTAERPSMHRFLLAQALCHFAVGVARASSLRSAGFAESVWRRRWGAARIHTTRGVGCLLEDGK
jgi:hypothetical protein